MEAELLLPFAFFGVRTNSKNSRPEMKLCTSGNRKSTEDDSTLLFSATVKCDGFTGDEFRAELSWAVDWICHLHLLGKISDASFEVRFLAVLLAFL